MAKKSYTDGTDQKQPERFKPVLPAEKTEDFKPIKAEKAGKGGTA